MKRRMKRGAHERGVAVLVVLVVIAIGALAGTVALLAARSAGEAASASAGRLQSRLTMRSGVLAVEQMAIEQRQDVLGGADLDVEDPIELFERGNQTGLFRLDATITPDPVSLDALLDINTCTAAMLARLPGMDETLGAAVAAALPVSSLRALLDVEGLTVEQVYGEYDQDGRLVSDVPPLASLLTVGSADPAVAIGVGGATPLAERVDVSRAYEEAMGDRLREALGEQQGASQLIAVLERRDAPPASLAEVARALRGQMTLATSGQVLDAVCIGEAPARGRVDINRAPVEVLAALPGLDQEKAQRIVDARRSLDEEALRDPLWPLREGVVDEGSMLEVLDRVTTRSVRWVLRAEAGVAVVRERSVGIDSLEDAQRVRAGMASAEEDRLRERVAMDLLVDFSSGRPVVVPLGEVSIAGELAAVARTLAEADGWAELPGAARDAGEGP
ncbi:MAG: type II secretion system protein GspK [Phycisphaerales bacterium]